MQLDNARKVRLGRSSTELVPTNNETDDSHILAAKSGRYNDQMLVGEEVTKLFNDITMHLTNYQDTIALPWRQTAQASMDDLQTQSILLQIGMNLDATARPLTPLQRALFGSPIQRIQWKIEKARKQQQVVARQLDAFGEGEADVRDVCLIQHFVLEQLSPVKRLALRKVSLLLF